MSIPMLTRQTSILNVYVPTLPPPRNQRRLAFIRDSIMQENNEDSGEPLMHTQEQLPIIAQRLAQVIPINWDNFWKRAKIYPDQPVEYPDASQHVSSRQRIRNFQRSQANANVSDTESNNSDCDVDVVIV